MSAIREMQGLKVNVDDVIYMPSLEAPADKPHPFVYFISIRNETSKRVTICGRKWVVHDGDEVAVIEGDGVIGQKPVLAPGEEFSYNSYHVTLEDARAEGAFFGRTDDGEPVCSRIPMFEMRVPEWA